MKNKNTPLNREALDEDRQLSNDGFTLIELIVVIAIIAILVLLAVPRFLGYTKDANVTAMEQDIKVLSDAVEKYHIEKEEWPVSGKIDELGIGGVDEMYYIDQEGISTHIKNINGNYSQYGLVTRGDKEGEVVNLGPTDTFKKKNLLSLGNIFFGDNTTLTFDTIDSIEIEKDSRVGGLAIRNNGMMEPNKRYQLSFSYQKMSGVLNSFGGHMYAGFHGYDGLDSFEYIENANRVYVDGNLNSTNYHNEYSAYIGDDTEKHSVVVEFDTDSSINEGSTFYIQPNRLRNGYVKVRITSLKLAEL